MKFEKCYSQLQLNNLVFTIFAQICSNCCQNFDGLNCNNCNTGMHLFRGICIYNFPNCLKYTRGFFCETCKPGYKVNLNQFCVLANASFSDTFVPKTGFLQLSTSQFLKQDIKIIQNAIKKNFKQENITRILKIYVRSFDNNSGFVLPLQNEIRYYRFIFYTELGFFLLVGTYVPKVILKNSPLGQLRSLYTQSYRIQGEEKFIDWENDSNREKVIAEIQRRFPEFSKFIYLDAFRYLQIDLQPLGLVYTYRVFLTDPNSDLVDLSITIISSMNSPSESLNISKLSPTFQTIIQKIVNLPNIRIYLQNAILSNVEASYSSVGETYNITFKHPDLSKVNNIQPVSNIIFVVDSSTKRVTVRKTILYKQIIENRNVNYTNNSSNNSLNFLTNRISLIQITPQVLSFANNGKPTFKDVPPLNYFQFVNLNQFLKTQIFDGVRRMMLLFYADKIMSGDIIRAAFAENQTEYVLQITYQLFQLSRSYQFYIFSLKKDNQQLEIVRLFTVPIQNRTSIQVNDQNRNFIIDNFQPTVKQIVSKIKSQPFYSPQAKLFTFSTVQFETRSNQNPNLTIKFIKYILKYYFPQNLNKTYQYAEFQYQIKDRKIETIEYQGPILFGKQVFKIIDPVKTGIDLSLDLMIMKNILNDSQINFTKTLAEQSLDRPGVYRIDINLNNLFILKYLIESRNNVQPILLSNKTIQTKSQLNKTPGNIIQYKKNNSYIKNSSIMANFSNIIQNSNFNKSNQAEFISYQSAKKKPFQNNSTPKQNIIVPNIINQTLAIKNLNQTKQNSSLNQQPSSNQSQTKKSIIKTNLLIKPELPKATNKPKQFIENMTSKATLPPLNKGYFNLTIFIQKFPNKIQKQLWSQVQLNGRLPKEYLLNVQNLKGIISNFFQIAIDTISNTTLVKVENLFGLIYRYTVNYNEYMPVSSFDRVGSTYKLSTLSSTYKLSTSRLFIFQISSQNSINSVNYPILSSPNTVYISLNDTQIPSTAVNINKYLLQKKPAKIISLIFGKSINVIDDQGKSILTQKIPKASYRKSNQKIPLSIGSPQTVNSNITQQFVNNYLTVLPQIVPIYYSQLPTQYNLQIQIFQEPQSPTNNTMKLMENKISGPNTYFSGLTKIYSQRKLINNQSKTMVNINHIYLGSIRVLASIPDSKILGILFSDQGYLIITNETNIIEQIPQMLKICKNLSSSITQLLAIYNYMEGNSSKIVSQKDIILWKYKKIKQIQQHMFTFEFDGFVINVGLILDSRQGNVEYETNFQIIQNKASRRNKTQSGLRNFNQYKIKPQFIEVQAYIRNSYGFYFRDLNVTDISMEKDNNSDLIFNVTYFGKNSDIKVRSQYMKNQPANKIKILSISPIFKKQFLLLGCQTSIDLIICIKCRIGWMVWKKDGTCYEQIKNCLFQSAELCLVCTQNFILNKNFICV